MTNYVKMFHISITSYLRLKCMQREYGVNFLFNKIRFLFNYKTCWRHLKCLSVVHYTYFIVLRLFCGSNKVNVTQSLTRLTPCLHRT